MSGHFRVTALGSLGGVDKGLRVYITLQAEMTTRKSATQEVKWQI